MTNKLSEIRKAVCDLAASAGCGCCRNGHEWEDALERLSKLLNIPKFKDYSGVNFWKYRSKK